MIPVPEVTKMDSCFGNISWLPKWSKIPEEFKHGHTRENEIVSKWFFKGLTDADLSKMKPKDGVDAKKALAACATCLRSFEPKHEHKEAGVAYLINQWFDVID